MHNLYSIDSLCAVLSELVNAKTQGVEWAQSGINELDYYRRDSTTPCTGCVVEPSIALVVQGAKSMTLSDSTFHYDKSRFLITSVDLPAKMQVLSATSTTPYLGIVLKLDMAVLSELITQMPDDTPTVAAPEHGMMLGKVTTELLHAVLRLVSLADDTASRDVLAPSIKREIFWRVLTSDQGARLRELVTHGSQSVRIADALKWLKHHFDENVSIDHLAEIANMSKSTFHHHFRPLTSMSPLQYQKRLRLTEARRLMIGEDFDASAAAYEVGYESPSQFSREYSRLFGVSPKRDVSAHLQSKPQVIASP